jgi:hypothetical protein
LRNFSNPETRPQRAALDLLPPFRENDAGAENTGPSSGADADGDESAGRDAKVGVSAIVPASIHILGGAMKDLSS